MIDEKAVQAAKFWERLRPIHRISGLREIEFEQFALMVLGLKCVDLSSGSWPVTVTFPVSDAFEYTIDAALNKSVDNDRWKKAWFKAFDALTEFFNLTSKTGVLRDVASIEAFNEILRLVESFELPWGTKSEQILNLFDEVFHRVVGRQLAIGYRNGDTVAALAAFLSANAARISEYFVTTGEFAVLRRSVLNLETFANIAVMDHLNFIIRLRLALHGIDAVDRQSHGDDIRSFVDHHFLLLDHPHRKPRGQRLFSFKWEDHHSSLEALMYLQEIRSNFDDGLIVVPGADRSAKGWRYHLREELVQSGRLLAVIDLPQDRRDQSRRPISAWLIGRRREQFRNHVLMVNAKGIAGRKLHGAGSQMELVAAIVSLGVSDNRYPLLHQYVSEDVETLIEAYFKDGYKDVEGVCRHVQFGELADNEYKLIAALYITDSNSSKKHKTFMRLLNSTPVLELLRQAQNHSTRIYVIGNNGEGKSMLLREIAEQLVNEGRRVVGMSFGLTDRFSFKRSKDDEQAFNYVGARTTEQGINLGHTSAELNRLMREIHLNTEKLEVFNAIVAHLGFGERRYLVPQRLNGAVDDREHYAELQQLTDSVEENARMFQQESLKTFELGLMRLESSGSITTFKELSSGEQQLLTLALKLTAYTSKNSIVLVDEPELSLHVSWQRAIPRMLEIVGSRIGCSMVVATHSPVLITSATNSNDKCFVAHRHALKELGFKQRRSVEGALFDGFRTYTANNRQVHERCAAIVSQTIQHLNDKLPQQESDVSMLKPLYDELESMEQIIRQGNSAQLKYAQEDLELVAYTRAAITEITTTSKENPR
ncbi:AAA family ATPase [Rheinheimera marina]|uniref:AAA family ATPase n=1 Tax=Rheinheimera marina TaxID=1774958 RepID=A0ABV9JIX2_9GAMM